MALSYDNLTAITRKKFIPKLVDNIINSDPMLMRLLGKAKKTSGERIVQPIKYAENTSGGSYSGLDTLTTAQVETRTGAEFTWKQYYQSLVLSGIDKAKNKGEAGVLDLVKLSIEEAETDLKDKLGDGLYSDGTGNSSKDMTGLQAVCDDSSNVVTYGGISRTDYTWWKANYTAAVGSLQLSDLTTMYDSCASGTDVPTIMVTTETVWSAYEGLLQPNMRYNLMMDGYSKMSKDGIGKGKENLGADGGFRVLFYRGTPIVASEYATSGNIFFLNEKYLDMHILPNADHSSDKHGFAMTDMKAPINQDGRVAQILWYGNLVCSQCRKQGRLTGVTS